MRRIISRGLLRSREGEGPSSRSAPVRDLAFKNRFTLKNENPLIAAEGYVVRQRSTVLREDQKRIPKQVRDDNERDLQKVMMGTTAFADSENAITRHLNSFQHHVLRTALR